MSVEATNDDIRAVQGAQRMPVAAADGELNFPGDQRADHPRGAAADDDDFWRRRRVF